MVDFFRPAGKNKYQWDDSDSDIESIKDSEHEKTPNMVLTDAVGEPPFVQVYIL